MDSFSRHEVGMVRCHLSANLSLEKLPSVRNEKEDLLDSRSSLE